MNPIDTVLRKLTFEELRDWSGDRILNRGRNYVKRVERLSRTRDDTLVAWVSGSERYVTSVRLVDEGRFEWSCTCPYWEPCKHAVAVILAAAERVKDEQDIPLLEEDDELHQALAGDSEQDQWLGEAPFHPGMPSGAKILAAVENILGGRDRDELLQLLLDLTERFPQVGRYILENEQLASGQVDKLVRALQREIRELTAEPVWYNYWKDEGNLPDYTHLEEQLRALADQGHGDAVPELGEELWTRGNAQVAESDDEGETAAALARCFQVVTAALPKTSMTPPEQLLWLIERLLEDEYGLLESSEKCLDRPGDTPAHWREVAEDLEAWLRTMPKPRTAASSGRYQRERLLDRLLDAYERAGWQDRIIPLLEDEVEACRCYPRLIDALLAAAEVERARQWSIRGYRHTVADAPGTASALRDRLREIAQKEGRYDLVAAYRAQEFFGSPAVGSYSELQRAAEKANCWPAVREAILEYLETGRYPAGGGRQDKAAGWPLPPPEVEPPEARRRPVHQPFPDLATLIDIAILEKRFDDVAALYRRFRKTKRRGWETDAKVARAVATTHPDLALEIWKEIVDGLIAEVKPKAYESAAIYLRLMKQVYDQNDRPEEWHRMLKQLRTEHKAKRRLMGVLDTLTSKKLVD